MKQLLLAAALLAPLPALAQQMPQPTPQEIQQAGAGTAADMAQLVVNLRAQLLADQRQRAADQSEIATLQQQLAAAQKPADQPKEVPK